MIAGRIRIALAGSLLLAAAVWTYFDRVVGKNGLRSDVEPGTAYAVACESDQCRFNLPFEPGSKYVVIIGSLGDPGRSHTVTIEAAPAEAAERDSFRRVLQLRFFPTGNIGAQPAGDVIETDAPQRCISQPSGQSSERLPRSTQPSPVRDFHLHVTDGSLDDAKQYARVRTHLVAEGRDVRIYLDDQQSTRELAPHLLDEMVRQFDDEIIPRSRQLLGDYRDVDGDGKFTVLLTAWLGHLQGGRTSLGGFVRGSDFERRLPRPFSNHCDMLYLNSGVQPDSHLRTLLAHEFTHAVCFSRRLPSEENRHGLPAEEDWLNEAIAHVAENLHADVWTNLDYRISRYLSEPQAYPLVVSDYYRAGLWRDHGCRGATYLFLRWCADQSGEELLPRLVRSPLTGTRNLEWATGIGFDELFRRWTIAVYESGLRADEAPRADVASHSDTAASGLSKKWHGHPAHQDFQRRSRPGRPCHDVFQSLGVKESAAGRYQSIDLRGRLAQWGLAGPKPLAWNVGAPPKSFELRGTAAAYVELGTLEFPGSHTIQIRADYGTQLQVSLIKLEPDSPRIRVETNWVNTSPSSNEGTTAPPHRQLSVQVIGDGGEAWTVEHVACELNGLDARKTLCVSGSDLAPCHASVFGCLGSTEVSPQPNALGAALRSDPSHPTRNVTRFQLPIPFAAADSNSRWETDVEGDVIVKVVVRDRHGRRASGWSRINLSEPTRRNIQLAEFSADEGVR